MESVSHKDKRTLPRKGALGCEKPWEADAVDFTLKLSFTWHRYNVYLVIFSSPLPPMLWLKLLQHQYPEKLLLSSVVIISLVGPCNQSCLLSQATVYCPTVSHLLKQIYLTGEAWGSQNSRSVGDGLQGW